MSTLELFVWIVVIIVACISEEAFGVKREPITPRKWGED